MGFSVSGAAAIIFISIFLAFGVWFTAASNSFDMVTDAQDDRADRSLAAENAALGETEAIYNSTTGMLTFNVTNTGTTTLSLSEMDLLVDGEYITDWQEDAVVADDAATDLWVSNETDLWLSNEQLSVTLERDEEPATVKLATVTGVNTQTTVTVVSADDAEENGQTDSMSPALFQSGATTYTGGVVHGI